MVPVGKPQETYEYTLKQIVAASGEVYAVLLYHMLNTKFSPSASDQVVAHQITAAAPLREMRRGASIS